jgi:hypothetical protein
MDLSHTAQSEITDANTDVARMVMPDYFRDGGRVTWQALKPRRSDQGCLSLILLEQWDVEEAYYFYVGPRPLCLRLEAAGALTFAASDAVGSAAHGRALRVIRSPTGPSVTSDGDTLPANPRHAHLDYSSYTDEEIKTAARALLLRCSSWQP